MELHRERYDENKEKKDTIDRVYANMNVGQGSQWILDQQKAKTKEKLQGIVESGAYEDADLVLDEAIIDLDTNKGLIEAKKSYETRQKEIAFKQEQAAKGIHVLDWGEKAFSEHSAWVQNPDTGEFSANPYTWQAEVEHDYNAKIKGMMPVIKANASGISQQRMDGVASQLKAGYLRLPEGRQHFRNLVELQYDQTIPKEKREQMAHADIMKMVKFHTNEYVHSKGSGQTTEAQEKATAALSSLLGESMVSVEKGYTASDINDVNETELSSIFDGTLLNLSNKLIKANAKGDKTAAKDYREMLRSLGDAMLANEHLTPAEAEMYKKWEVDHFIKDDATPKSLSQEDLEMFGAFMKYSTEDQWLPDFTMQGGMMGESLDNIGNYYKGALATSAATLGLGTPLAFGMATAMSIGDMGGTVVSMVASGLGNIRDWWRPQYQDLGIIDSERTQILQNIESTGKINKILGTKYTDEEVKYLKTLAGQYYDYKVKGEDGITGDQISEKVNTYEGSVFEGRTYIPKVSAKTARANIDASLDNHFNLSDWRIVGVPTDSKRYKTIETAYKAAGGRGFDYHGYIAPSLKHNIPARLILKTAGGDQIIVEARKTNSRGVENVMGDIAKESGLLNLTLAEEVRVDVASYEENSGKVATLEELHNSTLNWANTLGRGEGLGPAEIMAAYKVVYKQYLEQIPKAMDRIKFAMEPFRKDLAEGRITMQQYEAYVDEFIFDGLNMDSENPVPPLRKLRIKIK